MVEVTDYLDRDPISFFWVEEAGEFLLAWMTLIGAAVGIQERSHFTLMTPALGRSSRPVRTSETAAPRRSGRGSEVSSQE